MDRKLFGFLSGWQFTILASVAIVAPTALYAVTTTAVSITDPGTGAQALVDAGRRVWTYDSVAAYATTPANFIDVRIQTDTTVGGTSCNSSGYTIPTGKALILREITGFMNNRSGSNSAGIFISPDSGCSRQLTAYFAGYTNSMYQPLQISLGNGIAIPAGSTIYVFNNNSVSVIYLHGYLVPAGTVPAAASAEALAMNPSFGSNAVGKEPIRR